MTIIDWLIAFGAAFIIGFGKAGFKGLNVINVTLLIIVFGAKASTGILLPMLCFADILAVRYYNRHANWTLLKQLLPWMVIGVLLGVWVGEDLPEAQFKQGMAIIIFISVVMMFWWDQQKAENVPRHWIFGGSMGLMAGFTTMIGNLAGAFTNIFFLAMRIPKNEFIGTAAWLFFIVNLFKVPFHVFRWETITLESIKINAILIPAIVIGFYIGVALIKKINNEFYRKFILTVTALGAVFIIYQSFFS